MWHRFSPVWILLSAQHTSSCHEPGQAAFKDNQTWQVKQHAQDCWKDGQLVSCNGTSFQQDPILPLRHTWVTNLLLFSRGKSLQEIRNLFNASGLPKPTDNYCAHPSWPWRDCRILLETASLQWKGVYKYSEPHYRGLQVIFGHWDWPSEVDQLYISFPLALKLYPAMTLSYEYIH